MTTKPFYKNINFLFLFFHYVYVCDVAPKFFNNNNNHCSFDHSNKTLQNLFEDIVN